MDDLVTWITNLANTHTHTDVYSIVYVWMESELLGGSAASAFNTEVMKVCAMGVTVIAASGIDGAPGYLYENSTTSNCGYDAVFPASSPYVTAVGSTMGIEVGSAEVTCQSDLGGNITSGGGFSALFPAFAEQKSAISGYFSKVSPSPYGGYSYTGRGYPDVSVAGKDLVVVIGDYYYLLSGNSPSIVAGMISLINAARKSSGRPSLGWINPLLYTNQGSFANDVTKGDNRCTAEACCKQGYYAASGWDPVTGFGSIDFSKLNSLMVNAVLRTGSPTATPTLRVDSSASTGNICIL